MESAIRMVRHARILLALVVAALAVPLVALAGITPASARPASGAARGSDAVPRFQHIAVIMFADHSYSNILNNKHAPTFNRLARNYGLATRYYTPADPDAAGMMAFLAGNSYGVNDGSPYWDQPISKPTLLSQLDKAHRSWKEYVQDLPYPGYLGDCYPTACQETDSLYKQEKFNPVPDLTYVAGDPAQARRMVPASELASDARTGRLPAFSFVDTNECANMHGGPPWCEDSSNLTGQPDDNKLVAGGDAYLRQVTGEIMAGPQWRHGNNAIVITETEGTGSAGCCDANPGTGRVFTVVVTSHGPRHLKDATPFNHYSLLATVEHAFRLGCLQHACDTRHVVPMARLFGARSDGPESFPGSKSAAAAGGGSPAARTDASPARAAPPRARSPWSVIPTPDTGTNDNDLWSISGRSPSDIWAVGSLLPTASATIVQTLALHYNGSKWTRVSTSDLGHEANSLYGVAALPDGTAWATGIYTRASGHTGRALAEHWNGHRWSIVPAANPGSAQDMLYSAAAVRDSDVWAVGTYGDAQGFFHPLIEHWNGHRWSAARIAGLSPSAHGILSSVTAAGGHGVWATGQVSGARSDRQVVLHLVGGTWITVPASPVHGSVLGAAGIADAYPQAIASSPRGLWVAGRDRSGDHGFLTMVEGPGAGGRLRQLSTPNPTPQDNYLWGIAPVGGGQHAWAVGDSVPVSTGNAASLIEYGSAAGGWQAVPSPDPGAPGGNTILDGILAFSPANVWAVGTYDGQGGMRTLIMHYAGGKR